MTNNAFISRYLIRVKTPPNGPALRQTTGGQVSGTSHYRVPRHGALRDKFMLNADSFAPKAHPPERMAGW
jgi:hypothetical protein